MAFRFPNIDEVKDRLGLPSPHNVPAARSSRRASSRDADDEFEHEDYGEYAYDDSADYAQPGYVRPADKVAAAGRMPALVTSRDIRVRRRASVYDDASADAAPARSSAGLENLFSSTAEPRTSVSAAAPEASLAPRVRTMVVVRPETYDDAERVATALKMRSVVVLACAAAPDALMKRVLDFSFGAASALGAQVDVIAPRVFALNAGAALSDAEKEQLHEQGIL